VPAYDGAIVMVWAGQFRGNRRAKKVANGLGKRSYVGIHESEDVLFTGTQDQNQSIERHTSY